MIQVSIFAGRDHRQLFHGGLRNGMRLWGALVLQLFAVGLFALAADVACGQEQTFAEPYLATRHWTQFRGNNNAGVVENANLPVRWSAEDYQWNIELRGTGNGSPVIWQDRVFITCCDQQSGEVMLQCLDLAEGQEVWHKSFKCDAYRMHSRSSYASSTPAVAEEAVYLTYASETSTMIIALSHAGEELWRRDLGSWLSQHGFGVSPVVHGEHLIFLQSQQAQQLRQGQQPGTSRMVALSRESGETAWETKLTATRACYGLPCIYQSDQFGSQLVGCNTGDGFYAIDPKTGEMLWSEPAFGQRVVASPILVGSLLIGTCGSGGGNNALVAMRLAADGRSKPEKVYEIRQNANYVPSPLAVGGRLFMFSDRGIVSCLNVENGELLWRQRVAAGFSGSPVSNGSHVYCVDEKGQLFVIRNADEYELTAQVDLGQPSRATPAVLPDGLLLRTDSRLMLVRSKTGQP